ncbi:hypothetical protein ANO11243_091460 [Dothideomycetidae sp. 11243]|nr:hypothetical protein ANO11243_091460 [fungal sp. No.11243]
MPGLGMSSVEPGAPNRWQKTSHKRQRAQVDIREFYIRELVSCLLVRLRTLSEFGAFHAGTANMGQAEYAALDQEGGINLSPARHRQQNARSWCTWVAGLFLVASLVLNLMFVRLFYVNPWQLADTLPSRYGTGFARMCRDWNAMSSWSRERSACYKDYGTKTGTIWWQQDFKENFKSCPDGAEPWMEVVQQANTA